jgi:hypothetical protein
MTMKKMRYYRQFIIIYSINLLKTARKTFATGNAIYPLPRTIIQITNDNSIFRKEGIAGILLKVALGTKLIDVDSKATLEDFLT